MFELWEASVDDITTTYPARALHILPNLLLQVEPRVCQHSTPHLMCNTPKPQISIHTALSYLFRSTLHRTSLSSSAHPHMRLSRLIDLRRPTSAPLEPEDIFGSSLGLFNDLQNQHGEDPDTVILYKNARHGQLEFRTADVNGEEERRKFAHYLWNAGLLMGELVGGRATSSGSRLLDLAEEDKWRDGEWWLNEEEEKRWNVEGEIVLELGAGGWIVKSGSGRDD